MANNKKKHMSRREMRSLRTQQVVFLIISVIIVLAMILSLVSN
jgi:hypothetical protein